jgi:hypothetical protein
MNDLVYPAWAVQALGAVLEAVACAVLTVLQGSLLSAPKHSAKHPTGKNNCNRSPHVLGMAPSGGEQEAFLVTTASSLRMTAPALPADNLAATQTNRPPNNRGAPHVPPQCHPKLSADVTVAVILMATSVFEGAAPWAHVAAASGHVSHLDVSVPDLLVRGTVMVH